jgi:hypothetical protein
MKTLYVYSRPDCHLCDDMITALLPRLDGRAALEVVNVDSDLSLKKRYGLRIPILIGDGVEVSEHPLNLEAVEAFLSAND